MDQHGKKTCVRRTWLVGLFEVHWKTPYHVLLMEFLDTWREKKGEDILLALDLRWWLSTNISS
jgi:hypothetical protein